MELLSPEHDKYKKILQENPRSKVFAFLANMYRKYTMMDEALEVLEKGMHYNPDYVPGHVILAQCYYDQEQYDRCYSTLKPLVSFHGDNFKLQNLFAEVCEKLELWEEALESYRQLMSWNPKNDTWIERVNFLKKKLSPTAEENTTLFCEEKLSHFPGDVDEWTQLNFSRSQKANVQESNNLMDAYDQKFAVSQGDRLESAKERLRNFCTALNEKAASFLTR